MASTAGDLVCAGRYRLLSRLGSGTYGTVWAAFDEVLGIQVAIKELRPASGTTEELATWLERAKREVRVVATLANHPNIVPTRDLVIDDEQLAWIVMGLVQAPSLAAMIRTRGRITEREVRNIGIGILDALIAIHAAGILHRDIKPANILVDSGYNAILVDFGSAFTARDPRVTVDGHVIGTLAYIAPERLVRGEQIAVSDVYSLGATLYHALEGNTLNKWSADEAANMAAIIRGDLRTMEHGGPVATVISKMLELDPSKRIAAIEARNLLNEVGPDRPVKPVSRPTSTRPYEYSSSSARGTIAPGKKSIGWFNKYNRPKVPPMERKFSNLQLALLLVVCVSPWLLQLLAGFTWWAILVGIVSVLVAIGAVTVEIYRAMDQGKPGYYSALWIRPTGVSVYDLSEVSWDRVRWIELTSDGILRFAPSDRSRLKSVGHCKDREGWWPCVDALGMVELCKLENFQDAYMVDVVAALDMHLVRRTAAPQSLVVASWSGRFQ